MTIQPGDEPDAGGKVPWHLWMVGGVSILWNGFGAFDFTATTLKYEPYVSGFSQELQAYWAGFPFWMSVIWGLAVWGGVLGSLLLLMRRRLAMPFLAVSAIGAFASLIAGFINPGPVGTSDPIFSGVIVGIASLLFIYSIWMSRRQILN